MPTLEWIGKIKVVNHHLDVPYRVLEHRYTYMAGGEQGAEIPDGNKIIRGDNLEALKALLPQYEGRIKCIYIDPPYNTGNEGWVYNDNVNDPKIKKWLGEVVGKEGEDLSRHDKWLCMMYPRLRLLQRLLADDGAIFISIDDNEQANLRLLMDEIFGAKNFVATVAWQRRISPDARLGLSQAHDHIIVFAKNVDTITFKSLPMSENQIKNFKNPDNDPRGKWTSTDFTAQGWRPNQMYEIYTPAGVIYTPPPGRCWANIESVFREMLDEGRMWFGKDGKGRPRVKTYLSESVGVRAWTWWTNQECGHNQEAKKEINDIIGHKTPFDTPKPTRLIERILQIATSPNSIILDSFAGSGTTAHAVLNMNKQNGDNRKFILVEMMDYAESITAERVRRVIDGYAEVPGMGGSFSFYDLGEPLLLENKYINEAVPLGKIREYVWFMETQKPLPAADSNEAYLLGTQNQTAYYFYYEKDHVTILDRAFLKTIKTKAETYLIYADINTFSDKELAKHSLIFKKIPRDIAKL